MIIIGNDNVRVHVIAHVGPAKLHHFDIHFDKFIKTL